MKNFFYKNSVFIAIITGGLSALLVSIFTLLIVEDLQKGISSGNNPKLTSDNRSMYEEENSRIQAVNKAMPAVVSIIVSKNLPIIRKYYSTPDLPFLNVIDQSTETVQIGGGSGFIVSPDGYIVTNQHVVNSENVEYKVFLNNGKEYTPKIIAKDPQTDIAILKIEDSGLPYLDFADSDQLQVGQTAIAIGNSLLRFNNSVSVGVVSGLSRSIIARNISLRESEYLEDVIQTDAAINPGNSGGPLLNIDGQVIGINVAVASAENIGFALPSNLVKNTFISVKETGKIVRPFLGINYLPITEELKSVLNLPVAYGVLVTKTEGMTVPETRAPLAETNASTVSPLTPENDLKTGDIIIEVEGQKLEKNISLNKIINNKKVGDIVKMKILRDNQEKELEIVLHAFPL